MSVGSRFARPPEQSEKHRPRYNLEVSQGFTEGIKAMKIAMIGTGQIAQRHLKAFQQIQDARIVGHVGTSQAKADAAAETWGGRGYTRLDDLLRREQPEAVWITVPPHQHGALEYRLLNDNLPFLVEKPLSADRKTADSIGEAIARKNTLVAVGYNWRALDTLPRLRAALAHNPARMVIGQFHVNTPSAVWWRHQAESGGQFVEQATHLLDLTRALIGDGTLVCAQASTFDRPAFPDADIPGVSAALVRFTGDVVGVFSATCILAKGGSVQLQLICEGGTITLNRSAVTYQTGDSEVVDAAQVDSYEAQNRAFINAIQQNKPDLIFSTYADALKTHHLCHDIAEQSGG